MRTYRTMVIITVSISLMMLVGAVLYGRALAGPFGTVTVGGYTRGYFNGKLDTNLGEVIVGGIPASTNKTTFINAVMAAYNGGGRDSVGAKFIIQTMRQVPAASANYPTAAEITDWRNRINSSRITLQVVSYPYSWNSGYMKNAGNDDNFFNSPGTQQSIIFRDTTTNKVVYQVKVSCANPLGYTNTVGLPPASSFNMTGYVSGAGTRPGHTATVNGGGPGAGNVYFNVFAGESVKYNYYLRNTGSTNSPAISWSTQAWRTGVGVTAAGAPTTGKTTAFSAGQTKQVRVTEGYTIPSTASVGDIFCRHITFIPTSSTDPTSNTTGWICARVTPPTVSAPVCLDWDPDTVEAGTPTQVKVSVGFTAAGIPAPPAYYMTASITTPSGSTAAPAGYNNNNVAYDATTSGASNSAGTISFTPNVAGVYTIKWDFNSGPGAPSVLTTPPCSGEIKVVQKPYFKVYGGDAQAGADFDGADFATPCNTSTGDENGISAFNKGASGGFAGSSVQIAAIAADAINDFVSAGVTTPGGQNPATGLSIANDDPTNYPFGGNYQSEPCIPDYWSAAPAGAPSSLTLGPVNLPNGPAAGSKRDVFVEGDVYITGDVKYTGANNNTWSLTNLPNFRLIVKGGNIYIDRQVSELSGLYVAIPDASGNGGTIYTCSFGASAPTKNQIADQSANGCGGRKLVVYGSFVADKIKLLRTKDSLRSATVNEALLPLASNHAAEIFVYSPEVWLTTPETLPPQTVKYDAISSVAPIL